MAWRGHGSVEKWEILRMCERRWRGVANAAHVHDIYMASKKARMKPMDPRGPDQMLKRYVMNPP